MLQFPKHVGEAELEHNEQLASYQTVESEVNENRFKHFDDQNWVSVEEKQKSIESNELWTFWWREEKVSKRLCRHASSLDALMSSFDLDWKEVRFPDHKGSLHLIHVVDEDVAERMDCQSDYYGDDDWVSAEDKKKSIGANDMWTLHWYPDTPVGFCLRHAVSLEGLLASFYNP